MQGSCELANSSFLAACLCASILKRGMESERLRDNDECLIWFWDMHWLAHTIAILTDSEGVGNGSEGQDPEAQNAVSILQVQSAECPRMWVVWVVWMMWVAQRAYKDCWIILAASASPSRAFPIARSTFKVALTSHHILEFWCITLGSSRTFLNFKGKWAVWSAFLWSSLFTNATSCNRRVEVELREAFTRRFVVAARILTPYHLDIWTTKKTDCHERKLLMLLLPKFWVW